MARQPSLPPLPPRNPIRPFVFSIAAVALLLSVSMVALLLNHLATRSFGTHPPSATDSATSTSSTSTPLTTSDPCAAISSTPTMAATAPYATMTPTPTMGATASSYATMTPTPTVSATTFPCTTMIPTPTMFTTPPPIQTDCARFIQKPTNDVPFSLSLPPGTIVGLGGVALGTSMVLACTPNATKASINSYMNRTLLATGWHTYDATRDSNDGCGPGFNWVKEKVGAFTWDFGAYAQGSGRDFGPPGWEILTCDNFSHT